MGCDIHAVIEYDPYGTFCAFGEANIARDYKLFSALAFGDGSFTDNLPYPPRGLPSDHSLQVSNLFFVAADETEKLETKPETIAREWGDWALEQFLTFGLLPGPDWHTPSWLNFNELKEALAHAGLKIEEQSPEFRAAFAAMEVLAGAYDAEKVRLVFWFDG
jgi:hypothetical protein